MNTEKVPEKLVDFVKFVYKDFLISECNN